MGFHLILQHINVVALADVLRPVTHPCCCLLPLILLRTKALLLHTD
jgi:hypothetical protein